MENELINKVVTIKAKEERIQGGKSVMKIKDEQGLTYTVYKTKQDGTVSAAWNQLPDLEDTVQIGFVEQKGEYEGKPVTYRTIRVFNKDIGNGVANAKAQTPRQERFTEKKEEKQDDKFWEMKAYKQCLWNYWLQEHARSVTINWKDDVWKVFKEIEADANKRFFVYSEPMATIATPGTDITFSEPLPEELPTIQRVEDIPF